MAPIGSLERYIKAGKQAPLGHWITDEDKREHQVAFNGDYVGAVLWYRRGLQGLGAEEEKVLLAEGKVKEKLQTRTLMISGTRDAICLAEPAKQRLKEVVAEGLSSTVDLDAGHWVMLEQADATNKAIEEFILDG
jgi:soluble epoxide hydrolase/lipid-phosphate phosphatase